VILGAAGLFAYLKQSGPEQPAAQAKAGTGPAPAKMPAVGAPVAPTFTPRAALDSILAGASPDRPVTVQVATPRVRIGLDKVGFSIRSTHAGYIYIYLVGTEGNDFQLLFPNASDRNNHIAAGETMALPRPSWSIRAFGPPGTDRFVAMVSDMPRNFSAAGLTDEGPIPTFPVARAARLQAAYTGKTPLFAGVPECAGKPCAQDYGAAAFSIEEVAK
jgi:hypothetical protein